jgi:hypothetical protein
VNESISVLFIESSVIDSGEYTASHPGQLTFCTRWVVECGRPQSWSAIGGESKKTLSRLDIKNKISCHPAQSLVPIQNEIFSVNF